MVVIFHRVMVVILNHLYRPLRQRCLEDRSEGLQKEMLEEDSDAAFLVDNDYYDSMRRCEFWAQTRVQHYKPSKKVAVPEKGKNGTAF